jgi:hypothetical protein
MQSQTENFTDHSLKGLKVTIIGESGTFLQHLKEDVQNRGAKKIEPLHYNYRLEGLVNKLKGLKKDEIIIIDPKIEEIRKYIELNKINYQSEESRYYSEKNVIKAHKFLQINGDKDSIQVIMRLGKKKQTSSSKGVNEEWKKRLAIFKKWYSQKSPNKTNQENSIQSSPKFESIESLNENSPVDISPLWKQKELESGVNIKPLIEFLENEENRNEKVIIENKVYYNYQIAKDIKEGVSYALRYIDNYISVQKNNLKYR